MTFIEEELEALERNPEYKRFLKVYIKYQIHTLVQKLSDVGEESFLVTASVTDGTFSHVGSSVGQVFLDKASDLTWKFLSFCSSTDHHPRSFSPTQRNGSSNESTVPLYTEPEEGEDGPLNTCNSKLLQSGSSEEADRLNSANWHQPIGNVARAKPTVTDHGVKAYTASRRSNLGFSRKGIPRKRAHQISYSREADILNFKQIKTEPEDIVSTCDKNQDLRTLNHMDQVDSATNHTIDASAYFHHSKKHLESQTVNEEGDEYQHSQVCLSSSLETGRSQGPDIISASTIQYSPVEQLGPQNYSQILQQVTHSDLDKQQDKTEGDNFIESDVIMDVQGHQFLEQQIYNNAITYDKHLMYSASRLSRQCPVCQKTFSSASYMTIHMRLHTGEKPYKCSLCTASFAQKHVLANHVRTHTGERPYKCPQCPKTFTVSCNLNSHMRIHTGERPYQCKLCQAFFGQYSSLTSHMKSVHG